MSCSVPGIHPILVDFNCGWIIHIALREILFHEMIYFFERVINEITVFIKWCHVILGSGTDSYQIIPICEADKILC